MNPQSIPQVDNNTGEHQSICSVHLSPNRGHYVYHLHLHLMKSLDELGDDNGGKRKKHRSTPILVLDPSLGENDPTDTDS